jgi:hypothetical protein
MFIGHFAVGFAAKKFAPRTNMALLIAAPCFLDLLWPFFLLLGWEHVRIDPGNTRFTPLDLYDVPWSHSLLTTEWYGGARLSRTQKDAPFCSLLHQNATSDEREGRGAWHR